MMRTFFAKSMLIVLPIAVLSISLAGLSWYSGEALPIAQVVAIQQATPSTIYGTSGLENIMPLKLETYNQRDPDILILGSSRMLQMRDQFFTKQPERVYNASGGGWQLGAMIQYYEQLPPDNLPDIVILGIDQIWLNADASSNLVVTQDPDLSYDVDTIRTASIATVEALLGGDLTLNQLLARTDAVYGRQALGLMAIDKSFGYRADGSLQQGELIASRPMQTASLDEQIQAFSTSSAYNVAGGDTVRTETLERLGDLLAQMHADGVVVVGMTIPYHYDIYDMMQTSEAYTYMEKAHPLLDNLFASYGFSYIYFDDIRPLGAGYLEWYDSWHVTEAASLRMLQVIITKHAELFTDYVDLTATQAILNTFTNPMDILGELPE